MVMKLVLGFKRDAVAESWIKFLITIENEQTYGWHKPVYKDVGLPPLVKGITDEWYWCPYISLCCVCVCGYCFDFGVYGDA